jgi:hypothetical protein
VRFEQISHKFEKPIDADARDQKKKYIQIWIIQIICTKEKLEDLQILTKIQTDCKCKIIQINSMVGKLEDSHI